MIEDEIYRHSSQYRLWSFTPESLASLRASTNEVAVDRVRAALQRVRDAKRDAETGMSENNGLEQQQQQQQIDCLTPEEEVKLVRYYCEQLMKLGESVKLSLPTSVRATAVQFLRRFYLTNSPMTYHPKNIMATALFLASKTENYVVPLTTFADKVSQQIKGTTADDIITPEFLLTQGLRFTFDVRHPYRGLEGGVMELLAIAEGVGDPGPHRTQTAKDLKTALENLPPPPSSPSSTAAPKSRIATAHTSTKEILKNAALFTDAYYLYTPAQIWLSALLVADKPLADFYISIKFPSSDSSSDPSDPFLSKLALLRLQVLTTLNDCSTLLATYKHGTELQDLKRIAKKLYHCQNPEKMDLAGLRKKREEGGGGGGGEGQEVLEATRKKRKLERERAEKEGDVFGGELRR